jgi:predicted Zn-dependent peptidase
MAGLTVISRAAAIGVSKRATVSSRRDFSALFTASEEFPDLPRTSPTPSKIGKADITKLSNGLIVATEDGSSTSTVSLTFPNGGSSSETFREAGAAFANKFFTFKSALDLSSIAILRTLENGGASPFTSATRHSASVGYTCAPENAAPLVGAVISQTACSFEPWDVHETIKISKQQAAAAALSPEVSLTEAVFAASYGSESTLGRPFCNPACTSDSLVSFRRRNYVFDGAVLVATGVNHSSFLKEVEEALGEVPSTLPASETADVAFVGGEARLFAPAGGSAHVALSVNAAVDYPTLSVLKHCVTLSSSVSAFAVPGLLGVYGTAASDAAGELTDSLLSALSKPVTNDVIQRAKLRAKAEALLAIENGSKSLADIMTMNVLYTGSFTAASVAAAFDGITSKAVSDAFTAVKNKGVSLAAVGEIQNVPPHRIISSKF